MKILIKIQELLAHLFETHDAAHKSNITEIIMHEKMANEEISQLLQNLSTSETISNQDSQKLNNTIHAIKIQLSEINTVSKKKMTGVMTNLKHIDKQLASLLDIVNTVGKNLYSFISLKKIKIEEVDCILAYIFLAVMNL